MGILGDVEDPIRVVPKTKVGLCGLKLTCFGAGAIVGDYVNNHIWCRLSLFDSLTDEEFLEVVGVS